MVRPPDRRAGALLPWVALAGVSLFAFAQLRARRAAEEAPPAPVSPPAAGLAPPSAPEPVPGVGSAEARLTGLLAQASLAVELAAAEARAARLASAEDRRAAEAEAALGSAARARADELARAVSALSAEVERLEARLRAQEAQAGQARLRALLGRAGSDDPAARASALTEAGAQPTALLAALMEAFARGQQPLPLTAPEAGGLLRILSLLPAGSARTVLLRLGARAVPAGWTPDPSLLRALARDREALAQALGDGPDALRLCAAALLGPDGEPLTGQDRAQLSAGLFAPGRAPGPVDLRLIGLLRLEEGRAAARQALESPDPTLCAPAAWALARLGPGSQAERPALGGRALRLLAAADLDVRTGGLLLAEALLGERLPFEPAADPERRAAALNALRPRLLALADGGR